jgi:hypothetical protein
MYRRAVCLKKKLRVAVEQERRFFRAGKMGLGVCRPEYEAAPLSGKTD